MSDLKFAVGMSRKWDSQKAGREAVGKAITNLGGEPNFILVFCTIHYAKKSGLKKLISSCREIIQDGTPSIGGTISGFICSEGCFTRGVIVLACRGDMPVISAYGGNLRRTSSLSGKNVGKSIEESLDKHNGNKIVFELMPGPEEPKSMNHPLFQKFLSKLKGRVLWLFRDFLATIAVRYFQRGPGMEEECLRGIESVLNDYTIFGCSSFDDIRCLNHFQFYNGKVLEESCVALAISLSDSVVIDRKLPLIPTGKRFNVKRGWQNFWIDLINDKPAVTEYLKEMGWPNEYINLRVERVTEKTFHYPLTFKEEGWTYAFPAGFYFGETIGTNREIRDNQLEMFLTSSKKTMGDFKDMVTSIKDKNPKLVFLIEGMDIINILGEKINLMKDFLDETIDGTPYLVLFGGGEHSKRPHEKSIMSNFSMVMLSILDKN